MQPAGNACLKEQLVISNDEDIECRRSRKGNNGCRGGSACSACRD